MDTCLNSVFIHFKHGGYIILAVELSSRIAKPTADTCLNLGCECA